MSQPFLFPGCGLPFFRVCPSRWKESSCAGPASLSHSSQFSTQIVDKLAGDHLNTPSRKALNGLHQPMGGSSSATHNRSGSCDYFQRLAAPVENVCR